MFRRFFVIAAVAVALWPSAQVWAAYNELVPESTAGQYGLTRPWFAQVAVNPSHGRVTRHDPL